MYKFFIASAVAAVASAGVQIAPLGLGYNAGLGLGYAGLARAPIGYAGAQLAPLAAAPAINTYATAPAVATVAAAPAPVAYAAPAKAYALPAPRTIPGPTLRSEVVEPVEQWGYDVAY